MRRRILLILLALFTVPLGAQTPAPLQVPYRQFKLANGLNVILHRDTSVPVVAVNIWYHVGSANEQPGRTGFAHLFEHLMFEGSKHVQEGRVRHPARGRRRRQQRLDDERPHQLRDRRPVERARAGAVSRVGPHGLSARHDDARNESTASATSSRTSGARATRTGPTAWRRSSSTRCCGRRLTRTAGRRSATWKTSPPRATTDVVEFFKKYYAPNNASLVVAGDIDFDRTRALVEKWFGEIPRGAAVEPVAPPAGDSHQREEEDADRQGHAAAAVPGLAYAARSTLLATPRSTSRRRCSRAARTRVSTSGSSTTCRLRRTCRRTSSRARSAASSRSSPPLAPAIRPRSCRRSSTRSSIVCDAKRPQPREVQRAINQMEASFYRRMERVGSFGGKADQLNAYAFAGGGPDYFAEDLARYTSLSPSDVQAASVQWLPADRRVEARRGAGGETMTAPSLRQFPTLKRSNSNRGWEL